jgi:hypothetical protein
VGLSEIIELIAVRVDSIIKLFSTSLSLTGLADGSDRGDWEGEGEAPVTIKKG